MILIEILLVIICSCCAALFSDMIELLHIEIMYENKEITDIQYLNRIEYCYGKTAFGWITEKTDEIFFRG